MFLLDNEDDVERYKVCRLFYKRCVGITSECLFLQNIPPNVINCLSSVLILTKIQMVKC
jgi:hypothetical protein